jgi:CheY-like chemotaxis protein
VPSRDAPRRRILIADDNVDGADSLAALLRIHDHEVGTAYDGHSAIAQCEAFRPDVVLLDLGMPGLSGIDACRGMRALEWGQRTHIVALTGWSDAKAQRRCRDAGFDDWIIKPLDEAVLERMLIALPPQ